jgi:hypothetical protein
MSARPQKITFGEVRSTGERGLMVYCRDYKCSHMIKIAPADADKWPDDLRVSDLEPRFVCEACGKRGAELRGDPAPPKMGVLNR